MRSCEMLHFCIGGLKISLLNFVYGIYSFCSASSDIFSTSFTPSASSVSPNTFRLCGLYVREGMIKDRKLRGI